MKKNSIAKQQLQANLTYFTNTPTLTFLRFKCSKGTNSIKLLQSVNNKMLVIQKIFKFIWNYKIYNNNIEHLISKFTSWEEFYWTGPRADAWCDCPRDAVWAKARKWKDLYTKNAFCFFHKIIIIFWKVYLVYVIL